MIRIKFIEATFIRGIPFHIGEVKDVPDKDAHLVISLGRAVRYDGPLLVAAPGEPVTPAQPLVEMAVAAPAPETAVTNRRRNK